MQPCIIFVFILFYLINLLCVYFYYKLILINKFIRHNQVNDPSYDIKYLDWYWSLIFFNYIFIYHSWIFVKYIYKIIHDLFNLMYV
jgi:hypothetical protein